MRIVSGAQMRAMDEECIRRGVSVEALMEVAGEAVARAVLSLVAHNSRSPKVARAPQAPQWHQRTSTAPAAPTTLVAPTAPVGEPRVVVHVVAGKGHNGADGYVAARHLLSYGHDVCVWEAVSADRLTPLCARQRGTYLAFGGRLAGDGDELSNASVIVDALLGTGTRLPIEDPLRPWLKAVRESGRPVVAIDIPSGVDSDTGQADADAIRATVTVCCGFVKQGLVQYPGRQFAGTLIVATLGMPESVADSMATESVATESMATESVVDRRILGDSMVADRTVDVGAAADTRMTTGATGAWSRATWLTDDVAGHLVRPRDAEGNKGTFGRVAVLAGSPGMTGAARLAVAAAGRGGAGLVQYLASADIHDALMMAMPPEALWCRVEEHRGPVSVDALRAYALQMSRARAAVIGPGLGQDYIALATSAFDPAVCPFEPIATLARPIVFDATALSAIGAMADGGRAFWQSRAGVSIITPHPKEFSGLTGRTVSYIQAHRIEVARHYAREHGIIVVLKGAGTVTAVPDGRIWVNSTGNSGLATGGSGDVLAGLIGGMLASGYRAETAACLGVWIHGKAADLACGQSDDTDSAAQESEESLVASDILRYVGKAFSAAWGSTNSPGN